MRLFYNIGKFIFQYQYFIRMHEENKVFPSILCSKKTEVLYETKRRNAFLLIFPFFILFSFFCFISFSYFFDTSSLSSSSKTLILLLLHLLRFSLLSGQYKIHKKKTNVIKKETSIKKTT